MYKSIIEILNSTFGDNWFLDSGSLLGVIREGHFLSQDKGIDISAIVDSYNNPYIDKRIKQFKQLGFVISRRKWGDSFYKYCLSPKSYTSFPYAIDIHMFVKKGDAYLCPQFSLGRSVLGLKGLVQGIKRGNMPTVQWSIKGMTRYIISLCVSIVYRDIFEYFDKPVDMKEDAYKGLASPYIWVIPSNLIEKTEPGPYEKLRIVSNPDKYLTYRYGDWRIPISDWNTLRDDGGIKESSIEEIGELFTI